MNNDQEQDAVRGELERLYRQLDLSREEQRLAREQEREIEAEIGRLFTEAMEQAISRDRFSLRVPDLTGVGPELRAWQPPSDTSSADSELAKQLLRIGGRIAANQIDKQLVVATTARFGLGAGAAVEALNKMGGVVTGKTIGKAVVEEALKFAGPADERGRGLRCIVP
jgi:hypothetical protein